MRVQLMYAERDFDTALPLPAQTEDLVADLGLDPVLDTMANGAKDLHTSAMAALFQPLTEPTRIDYRLDVLADCLAHPEPIRALFDCAVRGVKANQHIHLGFAANRPSRMLYRANASLTGYFKVLRDLRHLVDRHRDEFTSKGLVAFCDRIQHELDDDYLDRVEHYLKVTAFEHGSLESVRLGQANGGTAYVLRTPELDHGILSGISDALTVHRHTVTVAPRDTAGMETLTDLADLGSVPAAEAMVASSDHVLAFFAVLRQELAFFLGCLNLHRALQQAGLPLCRPRPLSCGDRTLRIRCLYHPLLPLTGQPPVGNDVMDPQHSGMTVITGTNQGGKSTLLRAHGVAQLMMQAGMFAPAREFCTGTVPAVHTHFKRGEDASMQHGKFDEELDRFATIVERIGPGDLLLCNESFSATNEREAAEVGSEVIGALSDLGVKVVFVTHQYALARRLQHDHPQALFLRAIRAEDGTRPFRLIPGEPLGTSYAMDLYGQVFQHDQPAESSTVDVGSDT